MSKKWVYSGNNVFFLQPTKGEDKLRPAIYNVEFSRMQGFYLSKKYDKFEMPPKHYGESEHSFSDTCLRTWENTDSNLGILLTGKKGTGKTLISKIIANKMLENGYPVIIIKDSFSEDQASTSNPLVDFLSEITTDVVLFVDEYEKIFGESPAFLPLMDGVSNQSCRKMFLLTSNSSKIESNMFSRPSRIRYVRNYDNTPMPVIMEMIDDLLVNKDFKEDLLDILSGIDTVTVDVVMKLISEINIHNISASEFIEYFNTDYDPYGYNYTIVMTDQNGKDVSRPIKSTNFTDLHFPLSSVDEDDSVYMHFKPIHSFSNIFRIEEVLGSKSIVACINFAELFGNIHHGKEARLFSNLISKLFATQDSASLSLSKSLVEKAFNITFVTKEEQPEEENNTIEIKTSSRALRAIKKATEADQSSLFVFNESYKQNMSFQNYLIIHDKDALIELVTMMTDDSLFAEFIVNEYIAFLQGESSFDQHHTVINFRVKKGKKMYSYVSNAIDY